jgi:hypothetical protein
MNMIVSEISKITPPSGFRVAEEVSNYLFDARLAPVKPCPRSDEPPRAYPADLLGRIGEHLINRITERLPWNWRPAQPQAQAA